MTLLQEDLTAGIVKTFYDVYNEVGYGFLEKVYQNALYLELRSRAYDVEAQKQIKVYYKGVMVGEFYADLIVNNTVILELKAVETILIDFEYQLLNYLNASNIEFGLLLNFGKKPEFRRKIFENAYK